VNHELCIEERAVFTMSDNFSMIGHRIREMREICGIDAGELAKELNVSPEAYDGYEQNGRDIPISVLYELAHRFGVDLNQILTGETPRLNDYCVVRSGGGSSVERFPGYNFKNLAGRFMNKIMEPLLVTVEPSETAPALVTHKGQEFNMVLSGRVAVIIEDTRLVLEPGDTIYFNPELPHGQAAMDGSPATFLTVITEVV